MDFIESVKNILKHIKHRVSKVIRLITGLDLRYTVQIECPKEFLGTEYGGYYVCPSNINEESVVYSFGIGEDISLDTSLINRFNASIYAFDPTPKSIRWIESQELPERFSFFEFGLADYDGTAKFFPPENPEHVSHTILHKPSTADNMIEVDVHRLRTILDMLGHKRIDILKMDIEGAEFDVIEDLISSGIDVSQILVEFHQRLEYVRTSAARRAIRMLNKKGFKIFAIHGDAYSFIRT